LCGGHFIKRNCPKLDKNGQNIQSLILDDESFMYSHLIAKSLPKVIKLVGLSSPLLFLSQTNLVNFAGTKNGQ
jgi:hypothetical protein